MGQNSRKCGSRDVIANETIVIVGKATDMSAVQDTIGTVPCATNDQPHLRIVNDVERLAAYELFARVAKCSASSGVCPRL